MPGRNGGALNRGGTPGNKGGTGRPPQAFREFCAALAQDPVFQERLKAAAQDPKSTNYVGALKMILAYGQGLPVQSHEHAGADGGPITFTLDIRTPVRPTDTNGRLEAGDGENE